MNEEYVKPFVNSFKVIIKKMVNIEVTPKGESYSESSELKSKGVTSIISFAGSVNGRFIIDLEPETAILLTKRITGKEYSSVKEEMVLSTVSELNNIVAGDALTDLNNKLKLGLRLVPPVIFVGDDALVCLDKIPSESVDCDSEFGSIRINAAFERSPDICG